MYQEETVSINIPSTPEEIIDYIRRRKFVKASMHKLR